MDPNRHGTRPGFLFPETTVRTSILALALCCWSPAPTAPAEAARPTLDPVPQKPAIVVPKRMPPPGCECSACDCGRDCRCGE